MALRNLDFAAHQSVVNDDHFQNIFLGRTATKLADRLLDELGLFTKAKGRNEVKKRFESVFRYALDVKTQVIVGKYTFGTIWPSSGSAYEESLMKTQSAESVVGHGEMSNCGPLKVKLPLVPGLRFYSREKMSVDYCSFAESDESVLGKSKAFCKAVVAIEI